jgi:hypothetical protein
VLNFVEFIETFYFWRELSVVCFVLHLEVLCVLNGNMKGFDNFFTCITVCWTDGQVAFCV